MVVIVNPRGTGGSGKTALVRRILADYGWGRGGRVEPIHRGGRARPIAYRLPHPLGGRPLAVLGHYGTAACGGCDTIPLKDGGLDGALRLAGGFAAAGHDVLLEGLFLSGEHRRTAELARGHALHVLRLDTPIERCVRNLAARRRAGRDVRPLIARAVAAHRDAVEDACARLRWCAVSVEALDFEDALRRARELLGFRATAAATSWTWPAGFAAPALAGCEPASRGARARTATMPGAGTSRPWSARRNERRAGPAAPVDDVRGGMAGHQPRRSAWVFRQRPSGGC